MQDRRIAVVGMSAILPSGENVRESWEAIRDGLDCLSDIPPDRVDVTAYYNPEKGVKDKIYCKRGGFIPNFQFEPREFGLNMIQMEDSDANQTLTLLKVKEALADAGISPFTKEKKNIGCVLGIGGGQKASHEFYSRLNYVVVEKILRKMGLPEEDVETAVEKFKGNFPEWRLDSFPGFLGNVTAGRCSNTFNMEGMNCVVDAACASSLIALKVAIDELISGDSDAMICGATCTDNSIGMFMAFSKTPVFSTDQSCSAYDEKTKGMLIGEGSCMFLLKRYADAVRDGDNVHAVIRACSSSSDGKAAGIYTPTISGQEEALNRAYRRAGVCPSTVTLVEGHGTGTPVGDKIELTALRNVFDKAYKEREGCAKEQVAVGSIKSQIGHLKAVAGCAGLVKMILALKHKTLPQSINVENPPDLVDGTNISNTSLYINTMNRPWFPPPGVPRRCGVSSFGFGGANYHAVLEEFEPEHETPYRLNRTPQPVLLHAADTRKLVALCEARLQSLSDAIAKSRELRNSDNVEYATFQEKFALNGVVPRTHARVGFVSTTIQDAVDTLQAVLARFKKDVTSTHWTLLRQGASFRQSGAVDTSSTTGVAALFSGQGAQYNYMFKDVAMEWPPFRKAIQAMEKEQEQVFRGTSCKRISEVMFPRKPYAREPELDNKEISKTEYSQPATIASAVGVYDVFRDAGFKPDFVAGHSLGEFGALYAAGCVEKSHLFHLVCKRAREMKEHADPGGAMAAVIGPNADAVEPKDENVFIANKNSPTQVVLTGSVDGIRSESARLQKAGFNVVHLACDGAFHSKFMQAAETRFGAAIDAATFSVTSDQPRIFSNVTGKAYGGGLHELKAGLTKHMTSPVQFLSQLKNMYHAGARVFVEFGPKQVLSKLVRETLPSDVVVIPVNPSSSANSDQQLRQAAVTMAVAGIPLSTFDPWGTQDPCKTVVPKKKKAVLELSATTYVSPKTIARRNAILDDGKKASCLTLQNPAEDAEETSKLREDVKKLEHDLAVAERKATLAQAKLDAAEKELAEKPRASNQTRLVQQHRELLLAMLHELDSGETMTDLVLSSECIPTFTSSGADTELALQRSIVSAEEASRVVLEVLATKTGYETDMIELDMELETELGIDSIKRVEILSEVQSELQVEAQDVDALSRTRTVGEVIDAMKAEISGCSKLAIAEPSVIAEQQPAKASGPMVEVPPVAATTTSAPSSVDSKLLEKAERVVLEVLATKTGYETDMIELDMELETELGIDSIKRVEILSEVQSELQVEAQDVDALSRTRTVGEVIDAMKAEISGCSKLAIAEPSVIAEQQPAKASGPMVEVPPVAATTTSAPSSVDSKLLEKAERVVLEVLATKTGYETDMIELDMELETELGIDSIKRVEILSEVQSELQVEAQDVDALSRTRTVGEVIDAMKAEISGCSKLAIAEPSVIAEQQPAKASGPMVEMPPVAATTTSAPSSVDSKLLEKAERVVLEVLATKTGYETDMIELDMELETELGIDSIKRVEILSEVQSELQVEAQDVDALSRTRTVGEVIDAMKAEISDCSKLAIAEPSVIAEQQPAKASGPMVEVPPVAATTTSAPSSVDSKLLEKAERVVLEVLATKTGYETDMIELDMELETELGIDSIKRVEILSEVQSELQVEAQDVDALSRTRTVGEVIDAMKAEISGCSKLAIAEPSVIAEQQPAKASGPMVEMPPVAATTTSAPSSVDSKLLEKAERVVLEVLATKTGYETDMIELDMELETELGIDSIKRVEILSEVQSELQVEAQDVDALSRTRTVGEVIDAMKAEISGCSKLAIAEPSVIAEQQPAKASGPMVEVPPVAATTTSAPSSVDSKLLEKAERVVLEVLATKTGYETDMIELDMELETELGIDSIKRVEILSEVQSELQVEAQDVDALSRTRTVGEVIDAMKAEISGCSKLAIAEPSVIAEQQPAKASGPMVEVPPVAATTTSAPSSVDSKLLEKAERVVLEVLATKTGYETDMIELDMELETELGIDSIKRVEILSEVQSELQVEAQDVDALSRTRTVGEVIDAMKTEISGNTKASTELKPKFAYTEIYGAECEDLTLCFSKLKHIPYPEKLVVKENARRPVVVVDCGGCFTVKLCEKIGSRAVVLTFPHHLPLSERSFTGKSVSVSDLSEDSLRKTLEQIESTHGDISGFVFQNFAAERNETSLGWAMLAAKKLKASLCKTAKNERNFFVAVTRMDGKLGLEGEEVGADADVQRLCAAAEQGAVLGLCKTLDLEWPSVFCRGIDVSPHLADSKAASFVAQELLCPNLTIREVGYTQDGLRVTTCAEGLEPGSPRDVVKRSDVFLVSGGARGITPICVREVARAVKGGTFVLLGRSKLSEEPSWASNKTGKELDKAGLTFLKKEFANGTGKKPTPMLHKSLINGILGAREVLASIASIEAEGGRAIYMSCDVSSVDAVKACVKDIKDRHGLSVHGLVHASGVLRDKRIENKSLDDFKAVYGTKVTGLLNLLGALDVRELKHLVMFSSLAGFHGNVGQADYAMANEALNKIGFQLAAKNKSLSVKSICFGPWDGGMVTPALKTQFRAMGVQIIPRQGGAETVARIVLGTSPLQVLVGNWGIPPSPPLSPTATICQTLVPEENPFLSSHKIKGNNVLPMTLAIGYLAKLVKSYYVGYHLWALEDAQFFRGIVLNDKVECEVKLAEKSQDNDGKVKVEATICTRAQGKAVPCYKTIVVLSKQQRPASILQSDQYDLDVNPTTKKSADALYDGRTLFHGDAFRGITSVLNWSKDKLTAECRHLRLTDEQRGQFLGDGSFDPFMADLIFQSMVVWGRLLHSAAALPSQCERIDVYKGFDPASKYYLTLESADKTKKAGSVLKAKFYFHDEQGDVCVAGRSSVIISPGLEY